MLFALKQAAQNAVLRGGFLVSRVLPPIEAPALLQTLRVTPGRTPLVRLGPRSDGGYLLPDDLDGITGAISPGVSTESRFDLELAQRGIPVLMVDASVDGPSVDHPLFTFRQQWLDIWSSEGTTTLEELVAASPAGDLLLQMDIEGAEYRVLAATPQEVLERFRIIVLELHDLAHVLLPGRSSDLGSVMSKLLRTHAVVHVHPNNYSPVIRVGEVDVPHVVEVTLHRRDRHVASDATPDFPHPLDADCDPDGPRLVLPELFRPVR